MSTFDPETIGAGPPMAPAPESNTPQPSRPEPGDPLGDPAEGWREGGPALADWTLARLVNRSDAYGQYRPMDRRHGKNNAFIAKQELSPAVLRRHFEGRDPGDLVGLFSTTPAPEPGGVELSRWLAIDIDRHGDEGDPAANELYATLLAARARAFDPILLDSNGHGGYHLLVVFAEPRSTADVFAFGRWLIRDWRDHGLDREPETFPKQAALGTGKGFGNWLRLPGRHHTRDHWTRVFAADRESWLDGAEAVRHLLAHRGAATPFPAEAREPAFVTRPGAQGGRPGPKALPGPGRDGQAPSGLDHETELKLAREALGHYQNSDLGYDDWLAVGMSLARLGDDGLALWEEWSRSSGKYVEGVCRAKWASFKASGGRGLGSLFWDAEAAGWPGPKARLRELAGRAGAAGTGDAGARSGGGDGDDGPEGPGNSVEAAGGYETRGGRLGIWEPKGRSGILAWTPLANFDARIVGEASRTLGASQRKVFTVRASRPLPAGGSEAREVEVDAAAFDSIGWVTAQLGAAWSVASGYNRKDQFREGVQRLSALEGVAHDAIYAGTGWVVRDGRDYYLHAGGAIGAEGPAAGFRVDLERLPKYELPPPEADPARLRKAVRASLRLLNLGVGTRPNARGIAAALASLPWRAVLRPCTFAVSLVGGSGSRKTTTACLALQHFAPGHTYRDAPPAAWAATPAQLEFLQHTCKDSILIIDNFIADGPDQAREQAKAAVVLNNQGDGRGRARMRPDMTPMPELPPRGAILSTGEDGVLRKSAKGRSLIVKFTPEDASGQGGSIDLSTLTDLQRDADGGLYAAAMTSYIRHVARGRRAALARLDALVAEYAARAVAAGVRGHARTPGILAELAAGFRLFAEWAASDQVRAIPPESLDKWLDTCWSWLVTLADDQQEQQDEGDDARRFLDLITSALGCGRAHLVDEDGRAPAGKEAACGYRQYGARPDRPHWLVENNASARIGWLVEGRVYLDANEAARLTQAAAAQQHKPLSNPDTVVARLAERGWLTVERAAGKTRYKSRKTLEGVRRTNLLAFDAAVFWPAGEESEGPLPGLAREGD